MNTTISQFQNKPKNKKQRRLTKGEKRKIYEERFANRDFPAFRVVVDKRIMQFCPRDGAPLFLAKATYKSTPIGEAKYCPHCSTAFIQQANLINDFRTGAKTLWVCKFVQTCTHHKHKVVSATGILCRRTNLNTVEINIQYCTNCREYFITKQQYDDYKIRYKDLMGNLRFIESLDKIDIQNGFLSNLESPLHLNGYNVNQNSALTENDRRCIIKFVIDNNILNKSEVINFLSMFIDMAEKRHSADMTKAIAKWKNDLDWVNNYNIIYQPKTPITTPSIKPPKSSKP